MSVGNFNTANLTFDALMGNGMVFTVPHYQRDYSWKESEWEDLWDDIQEIINKDDENGYYLGYLVLQSQKDKNYDVIDGQQRLTTLSILILTILKYIKNLASQNIDSENNFKRLEALRNAYIGRLDAVSLMITNKLTLNRHNNLYFKTQILPLEPIQKLPNQHRSNLLLQNAFEWFDKKISAHFDNKGSGEEAAALIYRLVEKFFFTVIYVKDELNAYKVFETLNARGVRLSPSDLLKNYLFSTAFKEKPSNDIYEALQESWELLSDNIGEVDFNGFIRIHWMSRFGFAKEKGIFKLIKDQIVESKRVYSFIRELHDDSAIYLALTSEAEKFDWTDSQKNSVELLRKFNEKVHFALFIAVHRHFKPNDIDKVFKDVAILIFRYCVIGQRNRNELERVFGSIIIKINNHVITTAKELILELSTIYISDNLFKADFTERVMKTTSGRQKAIAKYILIEIEKQLSGYDFNIDSPTNTIEHIYPQNPQSPWQEFNSPGSRELCFRLGNMTLLEESINKKIGNEYYNGKKPFYGESVFIMSSSLDSNYSDWSPRNIQKRQASMAKVAVGIWKIQELQQ